MYGWMCFILVYAFRYTSIADLIPSIHTGRTEEQSRIFSLIAWLCRARQPSFSRGILFLICLILSWLVVSFIQILLQCWTIQLTVSHDLIVCITLRILRIYARICLGYCLVPNRLTPFWTGFPCLISSLHLNKSAFPNHSPFAKVNNPNDRSFYVLYINRHWDLLV